MGGSNIPDGAFVPGESYVAAASSAVATAYTVKGMDVSRVVSTGPDVAPVTISIVAWRRTG